MTKSADSRELILGILLEVNRQEEYSHIAIRNVLEKYQYLEKQERAFITRVAEGTLERQIELDYIINQFSKVKVNKMKPVIRNLLRMSVYQMKYMDLRIRCLDYYIHNCILLLGNQEICFHHLLLHMPPLDTLQQFHTYYFLLVQLAYPHSVLRLQN